MYAETGSGSSSTARTADVTLTDFNTGVNFDGNPGIDTISGTFTVTAAGSNGSNNGINVNPDLNGTRPVVGFDEATLTLSVSGFSLIAVNGASPAPGVSVTVDGFNGFTFGLDDFTTSIVVGVQTDSGTINYDNGTNHTDGTTGALFSFPVSATIVAGKGIGATSAGDTMRNEVRIGGVHTGQGLSFQFTGKLGDPLPEEYISDLRIDQFNNVLIDLPYIPVDTELLLEFTDDLVAGPWVTVDDYNPAPGEVGQPFRFDQFLSLENAFYRIRPNP